MRNVPNTVHIPEGTLECCTHAMLHIERELYMTTSLHVPRVSMSMPSGSQAVSSPLSISFLGFFSHHSGPHRSWSPCAAITF